DAAASTAGSPSSAQPAPPQAAKDLTPAVPHYAQLLSTSDKTAAEALAARLINDGFDSAYVERAKVAEGMLYRVRVKFASEAQARAAVPSLQRYTKNEIWVTKQ
ncbi:MAG: SPOR domain-containing protein, partial [Thermoanaerobaculia bacterium]